MNKLHEYIIVQMAILFAFGLFGISYANNLLEESNIELVEFMKLLPPSNNGIYFMSISIFLLIANISAMPLFMIETAIKQKYFPDKDLVVTKNCIKTIVITTPFYLLATMFYFELIYAHFGLL